MPPRCFGHHTCQLRGPLEWLAIKAMRATAAQTHASVIERRRAVNSSNAILSLMLRP